MGVPYSSIEYIYIYIYIYIYCDEEIWPSAVDGNWQESAADRSKQNNGKKDSLSLPPSQSLQGDVGVGSPHSLLAMCVSAGRQALDYIWYRGRDRPENQHEVNFQTAEDKLVAVYSSGDEDA